VTQEDRGKYARFRDAVQEQRAAGESAARITKQSEGFDDARTRLALDGRQAWHTERRLLVQPCWVVYFIKGPLILFSFLMCRVAAHCPDCPLFTGLRAGAGTGRRGVASMLQPRIAGPRFPVNRTHLARSSRIRASKLQASWCPTVSRPDRRSGALFINNTTNQRGEWDSNPPWNPHSGI
jgi:hypothetical protein